MHKVLLCHGVGLAPDGVAAIPVMVSGSGVHGELFVSHTKGWFPPGDDLVGLGEPETDRAQPMDGFFSHFGNVAMLVVFVTSRRPAP